LEADSWRKIEDLFHAAVDLNEAEADALLRCVDNESLRLQVASLLAQVRQASSFLEIPAFALITRNFEQPGAPFQTSSLAENAAPLGYPIDLLELKASFPETSRFALRRCLGAGGSALYMKLMTVSLIPLLH
jgi:hypothetical protein